MTLIHILIIVLVLTLMSWAWFLLILKEYEHVKQSQVFILGEQNRKWVEESIGPWVRRTYLFMQILLSLFLILLSFLFYA